MGITTKAEATRRRLLEAAQVEFDANGFTGASLRTIAKRAGLTTGALYGAFTDKDALFEALVGEPVAHFLREFQNAQLRFRALGDERQIDQMHVHSRAALDHLIDYLFDHREAFRLVLRGGAGSRYENWLEPAIALEEQSTRLFIETLRRSDRRVRPINDELIHILCSGFFHDIMETVVHDLDRTTALNTIQLLREYAEAGWDALLGISAPS